MKISSVLKLTIDLHLHLFGWVLSPLNQLDTVDDGSATWVSSPDSIRLCPPPLVNNMNLHLNFVEYQPNLIYESIQTAIDAIFC